MGLTQVLVADDGTSQTANLFGLDLVLQDSGAVTRTLLTDGLGSVRTEMVGDAVETVTTYNPYGQVLSQEGDSGTAYGFTGEQYDDASGLLYLRARFYSPYLNHFQSRDRFPGIGTSPQSQNGYSYADNNPVNYTDPAGLARVKIWASAFIEPVSIIFPDPLMLDPFAHWHGDGRSFYAGGAQPSARVWHEAIIDTSASPIYYCNGAANYTFPFNYIKSNRANTGTTIVVSYPPGIMGVRRVGKAPAPTKATISVSTGMVTVHMEAHAANPLLPAPKIDYAYDLFFDLKTGEVTVEGEHDVFPWHELYVTVDSIRPTDLQVHDDPSGPTETPADLFLSPIPIKPRHALVPALLD